MSSLTPQLKNLFYNSIKSILNGILWIGTYLFYHLVQFYLNNVSTCEHIGLSQITLTNKEYELNLEHVNPHKKFVLVYNDIEINHLNLPKYSIRRMLTHLNKIMKQLCTSEFTFILINRETNPFYGIRVKIKNIPPTVKVLNCSNLRLDDLSDNCIESIETLFCENCSLKKNNYWPKNLKFLCCSKNNFDNLDQLDDCDKLETLICNWNKITQLDCLPKNLISLSCNSNKLVKLDNLPASLKYLDCSDNMLVELSNLPGGLIGLVCMGNISNLDFIPETIVYMEISSTELKNLDNLPNSLKSLSLTRCPNLKSICRLPNNINFIMINNCYKLQHIDKIPESIIIFNLLQDHSLEKIIFDEKCNYLYDLNCSTSIDKSKNVEEVNNNIFYDIFYHIFYHIFYNGFSYYECQQMNCNYPKSNIFNPIYLKRIFNEWINKSYSKCWNVNGYMYPHIILEIKKEFVNTFLTITHVKMNKISNIIIILNTFIGYIIFDILLTIYMIAIIFCGKIKVWKIKLQKIKF